MKRNLSLIFLLVSIISLYAFDIDLKYEKFSDWPSIQAKSAVLIDSASGFILYEKNSDLIIPPASLTKIMTMHLVLNAVEQGFLSFDNKINITKSDTTINLQYNSTSMNLEEGMQVSVNDLLLGLAIVSANDAAYALARKISGTVEAFVIEMNKEAKKIGLNNIYFEEPSGLSFRNTVSAKEYAFLVRYYINAHPYALEKYHSKKYFSFPHEENMPLGRNAPKTLPILKNRNSLLWTYAGCDGLKTGYISESGYNIALTAKKGNTRLIAVVLGGLGSSTSEGSKNRESDGEKILNYGFENFITIYPELTAINSVRIYKGLDFEIKPVPEYSLSFTIPKYYVKDIVGKVKKDEYKVAPIKKGDTLGEIVFLKDSKIIYKIPLIAPKDIETTNIFNYFSEELRLKIKTTFGF